MTHKELRSYLDSATAYIFVVLFLLLTGTYVAGNIFLENVLSLRMFFNVASVVMLVFVPAVTMRLISEEKRSGTFELLGTKAVHIGEIVLGKFLSSWLLVVVAFLPTLVYAILLSTLGRLDWGAVISGYLGLIALGGLFVAVGLFASSLNDSQIVSLILGCILMSCLFFLDRVLPFIPSGMASFIGYFSAGSHFSSLMRGVVDSRDLVFYISFIVLFVLLATIFAAREYGQRVVDVRLYVPAGQISRFLLVGAILLFANLLSVDLWFRVDLTEDSMYTLSPVTKQQLLSLEDDLFVRVFISDPLPPPYHNHRRDIQELLEEYRAYSGGKLQYRFVNPTGSAEVEEEGTEAGIVPIHLKVVQNDKVQTTKAYAGIALSYADRFESIPVVSAIERLETDLTNAVGHLRSPNVPVVGLLTGQGEPPPEAYQGFLSTLSKHYRVVSVGLTDSAFSPAKTPVTLIIAPHRRFDDNEKVLLNQYIMDGGKTAFFVDAMAPDHKTHYAHRLDLDLDQMFDSYGFAINSDLVVDAHVAEGGSGLTQGDATQEGSNPFYPVVTRFERDNAMVANLSPIVLPYVSSLDTRLAAARGVEARIVATSSDQSARLAGDSLSIDPALVTTHISFGEENIPLAASLEGSFRSAFGGREGRGVGGTGRSVRTKMVVVGDGEFVLDGATRGYGNIAFALNVVDWLNDDIGLGKIKTRESTPPTLSDISEATRNTMKALVLAIPPLLVILLGVSRLLARASRERTHKLSNS
jgi:gliding-associated putative ABC transporter substrate-binding component GldG